MTAEYFSLSSNDDTTEGPQELLVFGSGMSTPKNIFFNVVLQTFPPKNNDQTTIQMCRVLLLLWKYKKSF